MSSSSKLPTPGASSQRLGATQFLATQTTFVVIATLLVFTRIWVRTLIVNSFGLDDAAIILAMILALITCAFTSLAVHYSLLYLDNDFHTKAQALELIVHAKMWSSIAAPIGIFSGLCARLSVCLFLLRIFRAKTAWRWGLYATMLFLTVVIVPTVVPLLAQCSPVSKLWNQTEPGHCWDPQDFIDFGYFSGGASVLSDWILATLPIVFMWNIQMTIKVKVGICVLMGMGYFTGICALVRTILFTDNSSGAEQGGSVQSAIWAILEINVGIIAASIPTIKPLFTRESSFVKYIKSRISSQRARKSYEKQGASDSDGEEKARLNKLTLGTMPSAMPTSMTYYREQGEKQSQEWQDLESQRTIGMPSQVYGTAT